MRPPEGQLSSCPSALLHQSSQSLMTGVVGFAGGAADMQFRGSAELLPPSPSFPRWKRALDLILVFGSAIVWLPLMGLITYAIKVVAPGPVFFRQQRVGYCGQIFTIWKFRSMKVNADTSTHDQHVEQLMRQDVPMTKLDINDARLIPLGRIFRASGLDELPQLLNVIRGEMSLVGPRPCTLSEFTRYTDWHKHRMDVPPGITGYWQVHGKNRTTFSEMIAMDVHYARMMSLRLDLDILSRTAAVLLRECGSCRELSIRHRPSAPPTNVAASAQ